MPFIVKIKNRTEEGFIKIQHNQLFLENKCHKKHILTRPMAGKNTTLIDKYRDIEH